MLHQFGFAKISASVLIEASRRSASALREVTEKAVLPGVEGLVPSLSACAKILRRSISCRETEGIRTELGPTVELKLTLTNFKKW